MVYLDMYGAILADPPWSFKTWSDTNQDRATTNHYPVMDLAAIKALPVHELASPNCALFMWAINSMIPQALDVITAWGFTFKTVAFTWAKLTPTGGAWHFGLGYWTRQNTEQCLLATRGKPIRTGRDVAQLIVAPRREHSRKPDEVAKRIERLVVGPYLEMFARQQRPGWDSWGNETEKFPA